MGMGLKPEIYLLCRMPELFRLFGIRFFFFSNEHPPIHVHVKNGDGEAKFQIKPVILLENKGMKSKDIHLAESIIEENEDLIELKWKEYFKL
jgi:hypothetical protein